MHVYVLEARPVEYVNQEFCNILQERITHRKGIYTLLIAGKVMKR